jgi:hypothetical protein
MTLIAPKRWSSLKIASLGISSTSAISARIGPEWLTMTVVCRSWLRRQLALTAVTRTRSSSNDSPPGKRTVVGVAIQAA